MQKGNYCDTLQISQETGMTSESDLSNDFSDNRALIELAQSADEGAAMLAMEKLLTVNRGLIRSIVVRFRDRGVDFEDLMQIGTIGLLKAVRSFDLESLKEK